MKCNFAIVVESSGDGSVFLRFFSSKSEAEQYAETLDERFCDDVSEHILETDSHGNFKKVY